MFQSNNTLDFLLRKKDGLNVLKKPFKDSLSSHRNYDPSYVSYNLLQSGLFFPKIKISKTIEEGLCNKLVRENQITREDIDKLVGSFYEISSLELAICEDEEEALNSQILKKNIYDPRLKDIILCEYQFKDEHEVYLGNFLLVPPNTTR